MRYIRIPVSLLLISGLASMAWAQRPFVGKHVIPDQLFRNPIQMRVGSLATETLGGEPAVNTNIKFWDLGTLGGSGSWASDVNDFGIAGGSSNPLGNTEFAHPAAVPVFGPHAMQWVDLGTFGGEGYPAQVEGVSDTGLLVGEAVTDTGNIHAFVWTPMTGKVDLGTLPGHTDSQAWDVNRIGTLIVGYSQDSSYNSFPVVWTPSIQWTQRGLSIQWRIHQLDTGALGTTGMTMAVNNVGQIVGEAWGDLGQVLVVWNPSGRNWTPKQIAGSAAYPNGWIAELNDLGEVVGGYCDANWACGAALWRPTGPQKAYKLVPLANPWGLLSGDGAIGINNRGDIVGNVNGDRSYGAHWTRKNPASVDLLPPADATWSYAANVNESGIAAGGYGEADFGGHAIACQLH